MNRGDFGAVYLPKRLTVVTANTYQVANATDCPLGSVSASMISTLTFTIPKAVIDQLTSEGLVTATTIDLYNAALSPTASSANMNRYLALLQQLIPVQVSD